MQRECERKKREEKSLSLLSSPNMTSSRIILLYSKPGTGVRAPLRYASSANALCFSTVILFKLQVMLRLVVIDDTNPSIQYSGPWFEANSTTSGTLPQISVGADSIDLGPPFQNTLHGVNVSASLSFNFTGSAVIVYGTSITTNAIGIQTQDPTWECFIDNSNIGLSQAPSNTVENRSENNWILCGFGPLEDGPHLLTVNASVSQQTFWFDQIQYAPSASVSLNQSLVRIDSSDSAIQYSSPSPEWVFEQGPIEYNAIPFGNNSIPLTNGANLTYEFSGTSISMFGAVVSPQLEPVFNYTIDDQEPITFKGGNTSLATTLYNQMFSESGQLSPGQHKLVVTNLGIDTEGIFAISYFVQVQLDAPSFTSSITSSFTGVPSGTSISAPSGSSSNSSPTVAIIGGVIGGLVLITLLIGMFFLHKRNNRRSKALSEMSYSVPSPDVVNPFTLSPLNPTSTLLPQKYTSNGQSLPSQSNIPSKFSHRNQPSESDPASSSNSGGIPPLTPLRPQFSSPAFIPPSSESPRLPLTGSQTNLDGARPRVREATTEPSIQRSPSPQGATARFLRHEDSGVRIPPAEDDPDVVELPPLYTPG